MRKYQQTAKARARNASIFIVLILFVFLAIVIPLQALLEFDLLLVVVLLETAYGDSAKDYDAKEDGFFDVFRNHFSINVGDKGSSSRHHAHTKCTGHISQDYHA